MTSPTQVALRELMILTKCYCGNYGEDPHPRLGHNCSFRPDVMTLVTNIGAALELTDPTNAPHAPDPWVIEHLDNIRRALLGLPDDGPPWSNEEGPGTG